ncbi:hypothetical protein CRUP_002919 [Coryphaenoides rupestris]|nr:hypothetical protein CRUP_002919 [Coryphaenoides rupestris]
MEPLLNFDTGTLEFHIHRNQSTVLRSGEAGGGGGGFVEGVARPHVYNLPLQPEEHRRLRLRFSPLSNHTMVESHLKECTDKHRPREPNFTLRRSFHVENLGQLPVLVRSVEINGRPCEGFGFKLELYIIISVVMSSMFLLVVVTAYLEALGIWEGFKKRLCYEAATVPMETGKPFDLREIVRLQNSASQPASKNSRGPSRPSTHPPPPPLPPPPPPSSTTASSSSSSSSQATPRASDSTALAGQHVGRRGRGSTSKQQQQQQQQQNSASVTSVASGASGCQEEQDYAKLLEAMDKDLERPELAAAAAAAEEEAESAMPPSCLQIKGAKAKLPRKPKVQRRREEAEARAKAGRSQGGEEPLREETDDSSSITTDTSTTDTEASFREELAGKRSQPLAQEKEKEVLAEQSCFKPKNRKQANAKEKSLVSSSLELPYVTPLENKRKAFASKSALSPALAACSALPAAAKVLPSKPRVPRGKLEEVRPSPLAKLLLPGGLGGGVGGGGYAERARRTL